MKIGIMGTHCTGKTTMAMQLASMVKNLAPGENVGILPELARTCPFPINEDMTQESQTWLVHSQVKAELECSAQYEILICDRTIFDPMAYAAYAGMHQFVSIYAPLAAEWFETYDYVIWARPNGHPPEDDGFRSTSRFFQMAVDSKMADMVLNYGLPVITADNIDSGVGKVLSAIGYF